MTPEEVAQVVIGEIDKNKNSYSKNTIHYVVGIMGSGKTTFIKKFLLDLLSDHLYINIDDYVPYFKEDGKTSTEIYQLCRKVGVIVTDYVLENNISTILEGTGTNPDIIPYLQRLKTAGYKIKTYFMRTQIGLCNTRVITRNKEPNAHKVDVSLLRSYHDTLWGEMYKNIIDVSDTACEFGDNIRFIKPK